MKKYFENSFDLESPDLISAIDDLSLWAAPFGIKLLETVDYKPNTNLLDVGFGTGFPLLELSQRLGSTCRATGIDPKEEGHDRALLKIKQMHISNVELVIGEAENMPFADSSFDLIVSNNGFNNVENEPKAYRESYRVCKTGGQMVFTFNLPGTFSEFYSTYTKILEGMGKTKEIEHLQDHIHDKRKSTDETKQMVTAAGFKVDSIELNSFQWHYTDGSSLLNHCFTRLAFLEPWHSFLEEHEKDHIFNLLENKLNEIAATKGKLSLTIPFATFNCRKK